MTWGDMGERPSTAPPAWCSGAGLGFGARGRVRVGARGRVRVRDRVRVRVRDRVSVRD